MNFHKSWSFEKGVSYLCCKVIFVGVLNQFDLITNSFIFLVFNFNWSLILLLEGYLFGVPGS